MQSAFAQKHKKPTRPQENYPGAAEYYYEQGEYLKALPYYKKALETDSLNAYLIYKLGICYLHKNDEKEQSLFLIDKACKITPDLEGAKLYLAMAYHLNDRYDGAIRYFNMYLMDAPIDQNKKLAARYIEYCENAKQLIKIPTRTQITNLAVPLNTVGSEYAPLISPDGMTMIYTYKGENSLGGLLDENLNPDENGDYNEDILISHRSGNTWDAPVSISNNINTKGAEIGLAISADGKTLYLYKKISKDKGGIYSSKWNGTEWSVPEALGPNINSKGSWEGSCSVSSDGQSLYFTSTRKGGFGGRDLYISRLQADGTWGAAQNLGPEINTKYDEDSPFICPDGNLFFSSKGLNSMGGYDIFYAVRRDSGWAKPLNMGFPLNSTDDDKYYVTTARGDTGYFSSGRKGTMGDQDLFMATSGSYQPIESKAIISTEPIVAKQSPPVEPVTVKQVTPRDSIKPADTTRVHPVATAIATDTIPKTTLTTATDTIHKTSSATVTDTIPKTSPATVIATPPATGFPCMSDSLINLTWFVGKNLDDKAIYSKLIETAGKICAEGLTFTVQIGAYRHPENFKHLNLRSLEPPPAVAKPYPDGITRFTMGEFKTFGEAEAFRQTIVHLNTKDAWITATYKGERKLLGECIANNFWGKAIK